MRALLNRHALVADAALIANIERQVSFFCLNYNTGIGRLIGGNS
jgi:uncharacterized membrane protein